MKAIEQYFHVVLFTVLYKVDLVPIKSMDKILVFRIKAIEPTFHRAMCITLYKVVLVLFTLWMKPKNATI